MSWVIAFFLVTSCVAVQSQAWPGSYTPDSSCNVNQCCCIINDMVITQPTSNTISFNTSLTGVCLGETSYDGDANYSGGYSISVSNSLVTLAITLSSDSNNLTITSSTSMGSACTVIAARDATTVAASTSTNPAVAASTSTNPAVAASTTSKRNSAAQNNGRIIMLLHFFFVCCNKYLNPIS
ncbi:unnamed protein product [Rotaria socialis]|uniref:Uncharacterized protein n=1 Tax=Rotaria socialis TaxID=392032 RepID=A0A818JFE7_9BILA|nr:unnamed protein product [Rotaria socialis]CAF4236817.1 unnamed protein product [Rotaria socialis]